MELAAIPFAGFVRPTLREVFRRVAYSVTAFVGEKLFSARKAVGVTLRLERAVARIDRLMQRFRRGELVWRRRTARPAADGPEDDTEDAPGRPARKPRLGLPWHRGWLAEELPLTVLYHGLDLVAAMQDAEQQALMQATPEVARIMRPIFRMFGLDEAVLKVPAGHPAAVVVFVPVVETAARPGGLWDLPDPERVADGSEAGRVAVEPDPGSVPAS